VELFLGYKIPLPTCPLLPLGKDFFFQKGKNKATSDEKLWRGEETRRPFWDDAPPLFPGATRSSRFLNKKMFVPFGRVYIRSLALCPPKDYPHSQANKNKNEE